MRRLQRAIIMLLGIAMASVVPLAGGSATAVTAADDTRFTQAEKTKSSGESADVGPRAKKKRWVTFNFKCKWSCRRFVFRGKCNCTKTRIILKRANKKHGNYKRVRRDRTWKGGGYQIPRNTPYLNRAGWYKLVIPANPKYRGKVSQKIHVTKS